MLQRFLFVIGLFSVFQTTAQNSRINERNTIGWYNYFGTFKINKSIGIHTEYQWRRNALITKWQQSLLRVGINYQPNDKVLLRAGYGWIETFPYGETPLNVFGKDFTEHRIYEMVTLKDKLGLAELSHRFMLEQRWLGRYSQANLAKEDDYLFLNRLRYLFRIQRPFGQQRNKNQGLYAAMYNEIFIGFGKQVNENIFDQNRLAILMGYRLNPTLAVEGGFLNQTLQVGREVNGRNVFQYNNGIILNTIWQFNMGR